MTQFYFFTENNLLNNQVSGKEFGPVTGFIDTQYRVTSIHSSTSEIKAYSVCRGIPIIQPVYNIDANGIVLNTINESIVNIILKPNVQPAELGSNFAKIKYFIYRGIKKTSLIDSNPNPSANPPAPPQIASSSNNDLTALYWSEHQKRVSKGGASGAALASATGIELNNTDSEILDKLFFDIAANGTFPEIKEGKHIGDFNKDKFGFEVVLDAMGVDFTFKTARLPENIISVNPLSGITKKEVFEHFHKKEEILNYLDPCAFFGSFYVVKLYGRNSAGTAFEVKDKLKIYDDLLKDKFINKDKIYIDIRNQQNHSFDYFKNYGDFEADPTHYNASIKLDLGFGTDEYNTVTKNYYEKWPILILVTSDFYSDNIEKKNTIKIHLPKGDLFSNEIPYGYVSHGNLDNNYPNSPVTPIEKFFKLTMEADNFSSPISLASPNYEGSTQPISSYIRLKYFKQFDSNQLPQESSLTVLRAVDPLDNIFSPFSMKTSFSGTGGYNSIIYENEYFIDLSKRFGLSFIANLAFAEDADNFIYFAYATEILSSRKQLKKRFSFTSKYEGTKNNFLDELTQIKNQKEDISTRKLRKSEFVIGGANIKYLEFKAKTDQLPENFQGPDYDELIVITISKKSESGEDFNLLQIAQNTFLSGYRTYLGIANKIVAADDKNHIYTSADLVLRGFVDDTPNGSIKIQTVLTNLKIYSYGSV